MKVTNHYSINTHFFEICYQGKNYNLKLEVEDNDKFLDWEITDEETGENVIDNEDGEEIVNAIIDYISDNWDTLQNK